MSIHFGTVYQSFFSSFKKYTFHDQGKERYDYFINTLAEMVEKYAPDAQLQQEAGFSANIITRLKRNGYISLESVESICRVLNCGVDDILEFVPEDNGGKENG